MKKLLLATLMLSSCVCFANVVRGPDRNGYYVVDSCGSNFDLPTETKNDKVQFIKAIEAQQSSNFKSKGVIALY